MTYDEKAEEAERALKPLLTDEFLSTLALAVRTCGYTVDHVESSSFVMWCFNIAEKERPNLDPFDYDD
jgi:hypothetical protein